MTTYKISKPKPTRVQMELFIGDETGALYVRQVHSGNYVCVVGRGGMAAGETSRSGRFTAVPVGTTITIEV